MRIHVHIERLILEGLDLGPGDGPRVQAAVEAELARLLSGAALGEEAGLAGVIGRGALSIADAWPTGGAVPDAPAPPIQVAPGARPADVGAQIARSVYGGIGGQR